MSAMLLAQQVLNGLLDGVYYLLIALGLSLIFSLGGIVNLAHGAFFAIGAYLTLVISPYLGFSGALVLSPVVVALLGVVIERLLFRRFYRADPILSLSADVRPGDGRRAGAAHDLRCATVILFDPAGAAGTGRSSEVSSIRSTASCCSASRRAVSQDCGCCCG